MATSGSLRGTKLGVLLLKGVFPRRFLYRRVEVTHSISRLDPMATSGLLKMSVKLDVLPPEGLSPNFLYHIFLTACSPSLVTLTVLQLDQMAISGLQKGGGTESDESPQESIIDRILMHIKSTHLNEGDDHRAP